MTQAQSYIEFLDTLPDKVVSQSHLVRHIRENFNRVSGLIEQMNYSLFEATMSTSLKDWTASQDDTENNIYVIDEWFRNPIKENAAFTKDGLKDFYEKHLAAGFGPDIDTSFSVKFTHAVQRAWECLEDLKEDQYHYFKPMAQARALHFKSL